MSTILIVEDDQMMTRMYQRTFLLAGHTVVTAGDGEEAIKQAETTLPNIILLDIMMPKMNGTEVLEKLKENAKTKAIPVVMLTNLAEAQVAEQCLQKGALKYVIKSEQTPEQLVTLVTSLVSQTH